MAGVVLCWAFLLKRSRRLGYPPGPILVFLVVEMAVGTVGGHIFNRLIPMLFGMESAELTGLTVLGSAVSTIGFAALYLPRVLGIAPLPFLDASAFTMPLAIMVGRFGCLLNGCCFGTFCPSWVGDSPLAAFAIRAGTYAPYSHAGSFLRAEAGGRLLWNLPLLLMLHEFAVILVAETLYRNRERWRLLPGTIIAAAVAHETGGRFFLEFLRWDEAVAGTAFNPWQLASGALFLAASAAAFALLRRRGTLLESKR